jgi:hypothetical protein
MEKRESYMPVKTAVGEDNLAKFIQEWWDTYDPPTSGTRVNKKNIETEKNIN